MTSGSNSAAEDNIHESLRASDHSGATTVALRAYGREVLGYLRAMMNDEQDALEAFSMFSERLWRSIRSFRGESTVRTWAYRLAFCAAHDLRRKERGRREERLTSEIVSKLVVEVRDTTPSSEARRDDAWVAVRAMLTDEERSLLALRVERQLPWREIANIMAVDDEPVGDAALRKRFERLRVKLRAAARQRGMRA